MSPHDPQYWKEFGQEIKLYRTLMQMGLREVSDKLGVSAATLCRLENGKEPSASTYVSACQWRDSLFFKIKKEIIEPK